MLRLKLCHRSNPSLTFLVHGLAPFRSVSAWKLLSGLLMIEAQYGLLFIPSMVIGRLFDKGFFHSLFVTFSVILILATVLVAECTHFWQFFICQGVLTGVGRTLASFVHPSADRRHIACLWRYHIANSGSPFPMVQETASFGLWYYGLRIRIWGHRIPDRDQGNASFNWVRLEICSPIVDNLPTVVDLNGPCAP